jgi:quercetin dioxygenase-like cupin family protein
MPHNSLFNLDRLSSRELFKDVLIRFVSGEELTLNYFELKSNEVSISLHQHPVEHLVIVLEGEIEFTLENEKILLNEKKGLFVPPNKDHTAKVIRAPVKALEIFINSDDDYYKNYPEKQ